MKRTGKQFCTVSGAERYMTRVGVGAGALSKSTVFLVEHLRTALAFKTTLPFRNQ